MLEGWHEVARIRSALTQDACDRMNMTGILQKVIEEGNVPIPALPENEPWSKADSVDDLATYQ
tara:strand:- start:4257 stop:4445 length:189 start_codon:yes stop_codon:yes gene_type:complete